MTSPPSLAARVEAHSLKAWPARAEMDLDGWRVRISGGFSKRQDCVVPIAPGNDGIHEKVRWCEDFYHARHLPCVIRLTDLYADDALEPWLLGRGYRPHGLTHVMTRAIIAEDAPDANASVADASVADGPDDAWIGAAMAADKRAALHVEALAFTMTHMPAPRGFAASIADGTTLAIGCASVGEDLMGIFTMRTLPLARRKGHARRIVGTLLGWGGGQGAATAWLQVEAANEAAVALYTGLGFRTLYNYRYFVRG